MSAAPRIIVIGARSVRQGTGPFIAAGLARAGADVAAVVGTTDASAAEAVAGLQRDWQLKTQGFADLDRALAQVEPDAVVISSPWRFHAQHLETVSAAGCHCLVEKPLAWPASLAEVEQLVGAFQSRGLLLQQVAQWPTTLPAFARLHGGLPERPGRFTMRLSPLSIGEDMITDSAPHFLSMLHALAGPGDCEQVAINHRDAQLALSCHYRHAGGSIEATLLLETCAQRPRPAWYQVDALRADREVTLPEYTQSLVCGEHRVELEDPMHQVAAQFLQDLGSHRSTDGPALLGAHRNLQQLAAAWR